MQLSSVSQAEISALYKRFRSLDRSRKGFLSSDELMNIPELSINPLAHRMIRLFEGMNFKEFCRLLAPFSRKATAEMKVDAMYTVFDVDGDGTASIAYKDLLISLHNSTGLEKRRYVRKMLLIAGSVSQGLCLMRT